MPQTLRLSTDKVAHAADLIRSGGLVAFPTETVYGLGADATNDRAVAGIFAAKNRPTFNPLIVHVPDLEAAGRYVEFSDTALGLARAFWPGALTLVLPIKPNAGIAPLVSAGLDTLAIRVPNHALAQQLLRAAERPVAAPSANPSGRISPTTADHVLARLDGKIAGVLDGGPCPVGVESTIIGVTDQPTLLRPGGVSTEDVEAALGMTLKTHSGAINAPGQIASHYAPENNIRLNVATPTDAENYLGFGPVNCTLNLSESANLVEAAANLFGHLHRLDAMGKPIAVAPIPMQGLGLAVNDRLARAAAPKT